MIGQEKDDHQAFAAELEGEAARRAPVTPLPLLPALAWSSILDCFHVIEADRIILSVDTTGTCSSILPADAANTAVKTLNMLRPSCFKTAHRFVGAEVVNIPCLTSSDLECSMMTMNAEIVDKIVPLLTGMPKLKKARVGDNVDEPFF